MSKNKNIFQRKEKKYRLSLDQFEDLFKELLFYMEQDKCGMQTISSLYYDTDDFQLIQKSIEKPIYREKFRIRSYGIPTATDMIFLELKKKFEGVVYKRRVSLSLEEATTYLSSTNIPLENNQIMQEIDWFYSRHQLTPKVLIAYDRIALFGKEDLDFRITFDFKVRWRSTNLDLSAGDHGAYLIPKDECLMEIKALGAIPFCLTQILANHELYPVSFSKYGTCYKNYLYQERVDQLC